MKREVVKFTEKYTDWFWGYFMGCGLCIMWMVALACVIWPTANVFMAGLAVIFLSGSLPLVFGLVLSIVVSIFIPDWRQLIQKAKSQQKRREEPDFGILYIMILFLVSCVTAGVLDNFFGIPFDGPRLFALNCLFIFTQPVVKFVQSSGGKLKAGFV